MTEQASQSILVVPPNTILYMLSQRGCGACAVTRPAFEQVRTKYMGRLMTLEMDLARVPGIDGWHPRATPALALKVNGVLMAATEGSMTTVEQIERFIARGIAGRGVVEDKPRHKRRKKPEAESEQRRKRRTVESDSDAEPDDDSGDEEDE